MDVTGQHAASHPVTVESRFAVKFLGGSVEPQGSHIHTRRGLSARKMTTYARSIAEEPTSLSLSA